MRALLVALVTAACSAPHAPAPTAPPASGPTTAALSTSAAVKDPPPPALRLPGDVKPTRYALDLTIIPDQPRARGRIAIAAEVVARTRVVWLNATDLTIASASLGGAPARVIPGGVDFIGLTTDRDILPGPLAIEVVFEAGIDPQRSRGLYAEKEGGDAYAYTFFEPIDARRAFPCFDEPGYKVPWQLTFHVKRDHVALANAPVVRESDEANGMKRVETAETRPLPSYLVAFVVGPFELVDGGTAGRIKTPIRFVIPKGRAGELRYAKQVTPKVVAALEDYFDMDYPYVKLDVAVVPRYWGTMEHPGLVAMGQPLTLIRPEQETRDRKQAYANILAHELAHYWFGDVVTMAWWDDTWLNEALGEWMDMIITHAVEPSFRVPDGRVGISLGAMSADEALSTQSVRQPVTTREGIAASFDGQITYYKGASVFRMFEALVGPDKWRAAMRAYIRAFEWKNATADDLLAVISRELGAPIAAALRTFLEQPGAPRIRGELRCLPGKPAVLVVSQQRALPAGTVDNVRDRRWQVPVCVRFGDRQGPGARACSVLGAATGEIPLGDKCPAWYVLNADANGYYRSVVDPGLARALLAPGSPLARAARPSVAEKSMLIADLRAMVNRGELAIDKLLALAPVIVADPDDKVASWAWTAAGLRSDALDDELYARARRFYVAVFGARARQLGWQRGKRDTDDRQDLRGNLVPTIALEDPALEKQAIALAERWLTDRKGLPDDMIDGALAVYAARATPARYDRLLAAAQAPRDRTEKARLFSALGQARDPALAARTLALVAGRDHDLRDSIRALYGVLFTRETRSLALDWLRTHIDDLLSRMRDDEASGFLGALAGGTCTPATRTAVAALVTERARKYDGAVADVTRGLEKSAQCIAIAAQQEPAIRAFLQAYAR